MNLIIYTGLILLLANAVLFTVSFKHNKSSDYQCFMIYMWCMVLVEIFVYSLFFQGINNLFLSHIYFILQFILLSLFYIKILLPNNVKTILKILLITTPVIMVLQYVLDYKKIFIFNTIEILTCSLSLALYAILFLYQSLGTKEKTWLFFSSGILIYLVSSSLVFLGGNYLLEKFLWKGFVAKLWVANNIIYIIYQVLITIEWYKNFRKTKDVS